MKDRRPKRWTARLLFETIHGLDFPIAYFVSRASVQGEHKTFSFDGSEIIGYEVDFETLFDMSYIELERGDFIENGTSVMRGRVFKDYKMCCEYVDALNKDLRKAKTRGAAKEDRKNIVQKHIYDVEYARGLEQYFEETIDELINR